MPSFKVIVIGAGPVGLTAAHALSKAGIDFVVLERRPDVLEDVGASLVLDPHNLRVASQFGLLSRLREFGHEMLRMRSFTHEGLTWQSWSKYSVLANHGAVQLMFHRAQLVQAFYEGLRNEDQARIHTGKKLATIENTSDGVIVTCADGSIYEGSIVLGADGAHSPTRKILRELALRTNPDADVDEEVPFSVEYKTMWCSVPRRYEFAPGDACSTHAEAASVQYLVASKRSWIFIYEKLDRPTRERVSYTKADIEAFAAKHGEIPLGDGVKVKDMFPHRTNCGMSNLEEGVLRQWSAGRIVLAGDACHKFTPNAGLGLNNGIQDIVALVNELHRCLQAVGTGGGLPGQDELGAVFGRYQERRRAAAQRDLEQSAQVTRLSAWPNRIYWFLDQWILPNIPGYNEIITRYRLSPSIAEGLCLNFVEGEEPFVGRVPWVHPIPNST